jgi:hypothetical protein
VPRKFIPHSQAIPSLKAHLYHLTVQRSWQKIWLNHLYSQDQELARCREKSPSQETDNPKLRWYLCHLTRYTLVM